MGKHKSNGERLGRQPVRCSNIRISRTSQMHENAWMTIRFRTIIQVSRIMSCVDEYTKHLPTICEYFKGGGGALDFLSSPRRHFYANRIFSQKELSTYSSIACVPRALPKENGSFQSIRNMVGGFRRNAQKAVLMCCTLSIFEFWILLPVKRALEVQTQ